jgi:hypothetical protein
MEHAVENQKQSDHRRPPGRSGSVAEVTAPQHPVLQLQQQAGNQAMQQFFRGDIKEHDANKVAGKIMRSHTGAAAAATSCSCSDDEEGMCEECSQKHAAISRKPANSGSGAPPSASRAVLNQMRRSPGHQLDASTRAFFEPRFGRDLSNVRVHVDSDATTSAAALNANAYTLGSDIYFGAGKYSPASNDGRKLLAHEMAHTVQQQRAGMPDSSTALRRQTVTVGRIDDPMEAEADRVADTVMTSRTHGSLPISTDRATAVRGNFLGDALDSAVDAGEWVGGKIEAGGEATIDATVDAGKWVGGKLEEGGEAAVGAGKWVGGKLEEGGEAAIEGAEWLGGKAKEGAIDAGKWVGGKLEQVGEAAVEGAEWLGGKVKGGAVAAGKWALSEFANAWGCLKSIGQAGANIVTGDVHSLTDLLGIPAPTGADPSTLDTIVTVLRHPCLQAIPGYSLVSGSVKILERVGKFLVAAWHLMQNPQPIIDAIQTAIGKMISAIPALVQGLVQKALQSVGSKLKEHGEGVWRHLSPKLEYLAQNWWSVIKQSGWMLLWPWPSVGKDLAGVWNDLKDAARCLWNLEFSRAIDYILAVERGVNSIVGALYGWFFIASVIVGAAIGSLAGGVGAIPGAGAGVAFAGEVGEGLLFATVEVETASVLKAVYNLLAQNETQPQKEADYEQIASSSLTLAITGAMFALSELAVTFAKALFSRVAGLFRGAGAGDVEGAAAGINKGAKVGTPDATGPKVEGTPPDKVPNADIETAEALKTQDLPKLREEVQSPNGVHAPEDPKIAAEYDAEIDVGEHAYRRSNTDGSWCRFSEPLCGIEIPEIKADVDTALAPKPEELPPEIAAEVLEPNSPEAITTDATPEATTDPRAKASDLKPGTPEHKAARWAEYQARGGQWSRERWGKVYDRNMVRAKIATAAEKAYQEKLGWGELSGNKPGVPVEGVERRFDIVDLPNRRGVEVKTGDIYLTQEIAWEILRDKILVDKGWKIEWHFEGTGSKPLLKALADAHITVT